MYTSHTFIGSECRCDGDQLYTGTFFTCCIQDNLGVTHTNADDKTTVSFTWTAPPVGTGEVEVRFAVVMVRQTYWANQLADTLQGKCIDVVVDTSRTPTLHIRPH